MQILVLNVNLVSFFMFLFFCHRFSLRLHVGHDDFIPVQAPQPVDPSGSSRVSDRLVQVHVRRSHGHQHATIQRYGRTDPVQSDAERLLHAGSTVRIKHLQEPTERDL